MSDPRLPRLIFGLLVLFSVVYFYRVYAQLPEVMASHFNGNGVPNGWMPKSDFFKVLLPFGLLIAIIAFVSPKLMRIFPPSMINLPNKDYWLAPERRAETVRYMEAALAWLGCAIIALMTFAFYIAVKANLNPRGGFDSSAMMVALGAFFVFLLFFIIRITAHFSRAPDGSAKA
ncbi:MAG TPA: DUF1648 domain-containing protein [Candidatus Methylomirabilis sp.]|nr:DUF1648 domain-containing protein [Candidatus Methylomirabilis sp.]